MGIEELQRRHDAVERAKDKALDIDLGEDIFCAMRNNVETTKRLIAEHKDNVYNMYVEGLNENNCNYRLEQLTKRRDGLSLQIGDAVECSKELVESLNEEYRRVLDTEKILLDFRLSHVCATEKDSTYQRS